jgi:probable F420-dependent oxidoreductase
VGARWSNGAVSLTVSVQASPRDRASWLALAAEVESAGLDGLYVGDHPGVSPDPFVALAAAAAVTARVRLGTCVLNAGVWEPMALANAVATLDLVSHGRAVLGIGAGHTPQEWTARGRSFPPPVERVARMVELVEATAALLGSGEPVSCRGDHVTLDGATLADPRPVQDHVPLMVGGNGTRVLRFAAQRADIVGITGLGRTLEDGHRHEVDWSPATIGRTVEMVHAAAESAGREPLLEALVQHVEITDDASAAARRLLAHVPGASEADLLGAPFVWIGTIDEVRERLQQHESSLGIGRYVVRPAALPHVRAVLGDPPEPASSPSR